MSDAQRADARLAGWLAELAATKDRDTQASLHYEIAAALDAQGEREQALKHYKAALDCRPGYIPAALIIAQGQTDEGDWNALFTLEQRLARAHLSPTARANALLSQAELAEDRLDQGPRAKAYLQQSLARDPEHISSALALEFHLRTHGERRILADILSTRANLATDPALKALLRIDAVLADGTAVDEKIDTLISLSEGKAVPMQALNAAEMLAFTQGTEAQQLRVAERLTAFAEAWAKGHYDASTVGVEPFESPAAARHMAAVYALEVSSYGQGIEALRAVDHAIALAPSDLLFRLHRMQVCEDQGDFEGALRSARALVDRLGTSRGAGILHLHVAHLARAHGETSGERKALMQALQCAPASVIARARLREWTLQKGSVTEKLEWLTAPDDAEGTGPAVGSWDTPSSESRALPAHLSSSRLGVATTRNLVRAVLEAVSEPRTPGQKKNHHEAARHILSALSTDRHDAPVSAWARLEMNLTELAQESGPIGSDLPVTAQSALLYHRYVRARRAGKPGKEIVRDVLSHDGAVTPWAMHLARAWSAAEGDYKSLAAAYALRLRALGDEDEDERQALSAARARALAVSGRHDEAIAQLDDMLDGASPGAQEPHAPRPPGPPPTGRFRLVSPNRDATGGGQGKAWGSGSRGAKAYAHSLREALLSSRGRHDRLLDIQLTHARTGAPSMRHTELRFLRAAQTAERLKGPQAATVYREGLEQIPNSASLAWGLWRWATQRNERTHMAAALNALALSDSEGTRVEFGRLEWAAYRMLCLGDTHRAAHDAEPLLREEDYRQSAAALLLLSSDPRHQALAAEAASEQLEGEAAQSVYELFNWVSLTAPTTTASGEFQLPLPSPLERTGGDEPLSPAGHLLSAWSQLLLSDQPDMIAEGLRTLASFAVDTRLKEGLLLEAAWAEHLHQGDEEDGATPPTMHDLPSPFVQEPNTAQILAAAPQTPLLRVLVLEEHAPRSPLCEEQALRARLDIAQPESAGAIAAALSRTLVQLGRHGEALARLKESLESEPWDLAGWEALMVAARAEGDWQAHTEAAEQLGRHVQGAHRALIMEALALSDQAQGRVAETEARLRESLALDPGRRLAYQALREYYTDRGDPQRLIELILQRIDVAPSAEEQANLHRDVARLYHVTGQHESALEHLHTLLEYSPGEPFALALLTDAHARVGQLDAAIDALAPFLSSDEVSEAMKVRIHRTRARYLNDQLEDPRAALQELRAVVELQPDEAAWAYVARIAEELGERATAEAALERAAELSAPEHRDDYQTRLARVAESEDAAQRAYQEVLAASPTNLAAAEGLAELLPETARRDHARRFQESLLKNGHVTDPELLRHLLVSTEWTNDADLAYRVLQALAILSDLSGDEKTVLDELRQLVPTATGSLGDGGMAELCLGEALEPLGDIGSLAMKALSACIGLGAEALGMTRRTRIDDQTVDSARDRLRETAALIGVDATHVFRIPDVAAGVIAVPFEDGIGWGIDAHLTTLDGAHLFRIAYLALARRLGGLPLVFGSLEQSVSLFSALAQAVGAVVAEDDKGPGPGNATPQPVEKTQIQAIAKALSRRERKAVAEWFQQHEPTVSQVRRFCWTVRQSALRAGLLVAGDLALAIETGTGKAPSLALIRRRAEVADLVHFWLSEKMRRLRRRMGTGLTWKTTTRASRPVRADSILPGGGTTIAYQPVGEPLEKLAAALIAQFPAVPFDEPEDGPRTDRLLMLEHLSTRATDDALARIYLSLSELTASEEMRAHWAESALQAAADEPVALRRCTQVALRTGNPQRALELLSVENEMPLSAEARALVMRRRAALAYYHLGSPSTAASYATEAYRRSPEDPAAGVFAARVLMAADRTSEAMGILERLAEGLGPSQLAALFMLHVAYQTELSGDPWHARSVYRKATRLDDRLFAAHIGLARTARLAKATDEMVQALAMASQHARSRGLSDELLIHAARAHHLSGQPPAEALKMLSGLQTPRSLLVQVDAARAAGDEAALFDRLRLLAEHTRRTRQALSLFELARLHMSRKQGVDDAHEVLRQALHADQSLPLTRLGREDLARLRDDATEMLRVARAGAESVLEGAAKLVLLSDARDQEAKILNDALTNTADATLPRLLAQDVQCAQEGEAAFAQRFAAGNEAGVLARSAELSPADALAAWLEPIGDADDLAVARMTAARELAETDPARAARALLETPTKSRDFERFLCLWAARLQLRDGTAPTDALERAARLSPAGDDLPLHALREMSARRANDAAAVREALSEPFPGESLQAQLGRRIAKSQWPSPQRQGSATNDELAALVQEPLLQDDPLLGSLVMFDLGVEPLTRATHWQALAAEASGPFSRLCHLQTARELAFAGDVPAAIDCLDDVLSESPNDPVALRFTELWETGLDADLAASRLSERVTRTTDLTVRARLFLRVLQMQLDVEQYDAAIATCETVTRAIPGYLPALRTIERHLMGVAHDPKAIAALHQVESWLATSSDPKDALAHARLAARLAVHPSRLQSTSPKDRATVQMATLNACWEHARPDLWLAGTMWHLARLLEQPKRIEEALRELGETLEGHEKDVIQRAHVSQIAKISGPKEALRRLEVLKDRRLRETMWAELKADLHRAQGMYREAARAYEQAADGSTSRLRAASLLSEASVALHEAGDASRSTKLLIKAAKAHSELPGLLDKLWHLKGTAVPKQELAAILAERIRRGGAPSEMLPLHLKLGELYQNLEQWTQAKQVLRASLELDPKNLHALEALCSVCEAQRDLRGAADALLLARRVANKPQSLRAIHLRLGRIYELAGDKRRAAAAYQQVIAEFPDDEFALLRLEQLGADA